MLDGRKPVRDDQGGAGRDQLVDGLLDMALGLGVQRRGGFVEDQDRRVLQQGAGDGQALPLAAGEQHAALADQGVEPLGQFLDEFPGIGLARGLDDAVFGHFIEGAVGDIVAHRIVEQAHILADIGDLSPQVGEAIVADVVSVEQNPALAEFVETRQQVHQRGLATAGTSDNGHGLVGEDIEFHVLEHLPLVPRVAEPDLLEGDAAAGGLEGLLPPVLLARARQELEHALTGGYALLDLRIHRRQAAHGREQAGHGEDEGNEIARGNAPLHGLGGGEGDDQRKGDGDDQLDQRHADGLGRGHLQVEPEIARVDALELAFLVLLAAEDAHHAIALDDFLGHMRNLAHGFLDVLADLAEAPGNLDHDPEHQRTDGEKDQAQLPAQPQHVTEQNDDAQAVLDERGQRRGHRGRHLLDIVGKLGDDGAARCLVVFAGGQGQQLVEHLAAQVVDHLSADIGHAVGAQEGRHHAHHEDADDGQRHPADSGRVALDEAVVEHRLHQPGEGRLGHREHHHAEYRQAKPGLVFHRQRHQAAVGGQSAFFRILSGLGRQGH